MMLSLSGGGSARADGGNAFANRVIGGRRGRNSPLGATMHSQPLHAARLIAEPEPPFTPIGFNLKVEIISL